MVIWYNHVLEVSDRQTYIHTAEPLVSETIVS